jgi:hypothetical protein
MRRLIFKPSSFFSFVRPKEKKQKKKVPPKETEEDMLVLYTTRS